MTATHNTNCIASCAPVLYLALDLGAGNWKLAFTVGLGQKPRLKEWKGPPTFWHLGSVGGSFRRLSLSHPTE
jgi:hypothetical protein